MKAIFFMCFLFSCEKSEQSSELMPRIVATPIDNDPRGSLAIDPIFIPIVDKFEKIWGEKVKTPIWFSYRLPAGTLAVCHTFTRGDGLELTEIIVQRQNYNPGSLRAEITIFHELGHCELKREHDVYIARGHDERFIAFSMMYPTIIDEDDYEEYMEHYHLELFNRGSLLDMFESED